MGWVLPWWSGKLVWSDCEHLEDGRLALFLAIDSKFLMQSSTNSYLNICKIKKNKWAVRVHWHQQSTIKKDFTRTSNDIMGRKDVKGKTMLGFCLHFYFKFRVWSAGPYVHR